MNAIPATRPPPETVRSKWTLLRPYLFDVVGPFIAYAVVHAFGVAGFWAMTAAGAVAGLSTAINSLRRKKLDALGVLVLLEIAASIVVVAFVRDPRILLARPSIYTGIASAYIAASAFLRRPVSFHGSRIMVASKGPARLAAFDRAWDTSAEFRLTHRVVTFALGLCLAVDSVLRLIIVFRFPLERAAWLSNVPHLSALALMMVLSALAGRRFKRLVEQQMSADQRR